MKKKDRAGLLQIRILFQFFSAKHEPKNQSTSPCGRFYKYPCSADKICQRPSFRKNDTAGRSDNDASWRPRFRAAVCARSVSSKARRRLADWSTPQLRISSSCRYLLPLIHFQARSTLVQKPNDIADDDQTRRFRIVALNFCRNVSKSAGYDDLLRHRSAEDNCNGLSRGSAIRNKFSNDAIYSPNAHVNHQRIR
jgi:hypothetical protein